jgi:restriction system protein
MLPLLEFGRDGRPHMFDEAFQALAAGLALSERERHEWQPSGAQRKFENRIRWAELYLRKAGLLERVRPQRSYGPRSGKRAIFRITESGRRILAHGPNRIDEAFLRRVSPDFDARTRTSRRMQASASRRAVLVATERRGPVSGRRRRLGVQGPGAWRRVRASARGRLSHARH